MSIDAPTDSGVDSLPEADTEPRRGPKPVAHGSSVQTVFNDLDLNLELDIDGVDTDRETTIYDAALGYWREHVGDRDRQPYIVAELDDDDLEWLPPARYGRSYALVLTSSRWKAGVGEDDNYRAYYEYHLKLREVDGDELHKPPLALHIEIMPQDSDLNYQDGNPLELPYGEGSRVVAWTTWADSSEAVETRMLDAIELVFGADRDRLELARNHDSRRLAKAEAHVRFQISKKSQVVETVEQSKQLIAYGGESDIDAHQRRQRDGWLEASVDADRWELLGFDDTNYDVQLKVYQAASWADIPPSEPGHHPKLEASFAGVNGDGKLPHVDDWDEVLGNLRGIVSSHLDWAAVDRGDLVEDDFFDGPNVAEHEYQHPTNRREQLYERYKAVSTDLYKEALKTNTKAVYDILRVVAREKGASYDVLEATTGLARSTVRYHVRRLDEAGIVDRLAGAETLVVFPSLVVLDKAEEILREVFPDDTLDDAEERAEERRERREDGDWGDDVDDTDQDDEPDDGDRRDSTWRYFADLPLEPHQLANALERDYLEGDEVRVRTDRRDWLG